MAELETCASQLEMQLEQGPLQVRITESKYLLLYDGAQALKLRLATGASCNGEIEFCLIRASKDVLGYTEALLTKTVKFHYTVRKSFWNRFASLIQ